MGALGQGLLPAGLEFFQSVLANCFQHHEARFALRLLDLLHQALVHHGCHAVEQIQIEIALGVANGFHAFQSASAHEHRQSSEKLLLGGTQQVVAPIHGGAQRLLPLRQVARAAGQQLQPARQARQHGRGRKNFDPRGRQFDGERQTIQTGANLGDRGRVFPVELKIRLGGDGALHEQRDRGVLRQRPQRKAMDRESGSASGGTGNSCSP